MTVNNFRIILLVYFLVSVTWLGAKTIYVNAESGDDANTGLSQDSPIQTLSGLRQITLLPGDSVLLRAGHEFRGSIMIRGFEGKAEKPLVISSYPENEGKAIINAAGQFAAVLLENTGFVQVKNLELTANAGGPIDKPVTKGPMRCGILVLGSQAGKYQNIVIDNVFVHDIYYEEPGFERGAEEVNTPNGKQHYGWGIRVIALHEKAMMEDITISDSKIENVSHTGIKFTGSRKQPSSIYRIEVAGNVVQFTGGPGIQMSNVKNVHVHHNKVDHSGSNDDSRKWGRGSGLWTWSSDSVVVEHNSFTNASGPGDSAGAHIDFNCSNVVFQYNLSANNAGGFCEILGNNYNCSYRYNISVNDGYRVKGEDGAFQEGKIFWLSGYVGNAPRTGPFNSYFYNNTIYVSRDIVAKIAVDQASAGVLVANNIFHIEGESRLVLGDQYKPEERGDSTATIPNVVFTNNVFLNDRNWPGDVLIQPSSSAYADVKFSQPGEVSLEAYIPGNKKVIKNKGIKIGPVPGDDIGLKIGLKVKEDILGNPVKGRPDIGAIEIR